MNGPANQVVGIQYEPGAGLPAVVLKGAGPVAEEILRRGARESIPAIRDPQLLRQLYRLPVDGQIGPELFQMVALILAHVISVADKARGEVNG